MITSNYLKFKNIRDISDKTDITNKYFLILPNGDYTGIIKTMDLLKFDFIKSPETVIEITYEAANSFIGIVKIVKHLKPFHPIIFYLDSKGILLYSYNMERSKNAPF